jgi:hypothetical protein
LIGGIFNVIGSEFNFDVTFVISIDIQYSAQDISRKNFFLDSYYSHITTRRDIPHHHTA